jgi:sialate O-acetylesterase
MSLEDEDLVLILGKIDDIDQCFINGKMIGSTGDFVITPETNNFNNEWLELRGYYIPKELLKFGEYNVIAVRVYDGFFEGGIYQGPIGIAVQDEYRKYWKERKRKRNFWDYLFDK